MGREQKIVIATLAVGCTLGLVLWVIGSDAEPPTMGPVEVVAQAPREAQRAAELSETHQVPITTSPFEPTAEPAARPQPTFVSGRIRDVDGALAVGARVGMGRSTMQGHEESVAEWAEVSADLEGRYRFRATPGWTVRLWADSSSSVATLLPAFEIQAGENRVEDIELVRGGAISGQIRDESGAPRRNSHVEIQALGLADAECPEMRALFLLPKSVQPRMARCVATDEYGNYRLEGVHPHSELRMSVQLAQLTSRQGSVTARAGAASVDFDLERVRESVIRGRVIEVIGASLHRIRVQVRADR